MEVTVRQANESNSTNCSDTIGHSDATNILLAGSVVTAISIVAALMPSALVFYLGLHRQFTYRVALYQVLAAMLYHCAGLSASLVPLSIDRSQGYIAPICQATAFAITFFFWLKLLFVTFIVVHLFIFAVTYRNIRRVEPVYICSSVLFSLAVSAVPFTTNTYGIAGTWCWIQNWKDECSTEVIAAGVIEQFVLYYAPGLVLLTADSLAVVVMMGVLSLRLRWVKRKGGAKARHPLREALK